VGTGGFRVFRVGRIKAKGGSRCHEVMERGHKGWELGSAKARAVVLVVGAMEG
jgi:hypothetical protein